MQDALAQRDAEIERLSALVARGPDVDRLAQQYRTEANEAVILQLNQQARQLGSWRPGRSSQGFTETPVFEINGAPWVTWRVVAWCEGFGRLMGCIRVCVALVQVEALTSELVEVQRRAVDRGDLEAAQQAQRQAEARASSLAAEREGVAREVEAMQAALVRLQQESAGEGAARQKLGRLRSTLEGVRAEKALLEGQLTHAEAKVAELRDVLEQREVRGWGHASGPVGKQPAHRVHAQAMPGFALHAALHFLTAHLPRCAPGLGSAAQGAGPLQAAGGGALCFCPEAGAAAARARGLGQPAGGSRCCQPAGAVPGAGGSAGRG